MFEFGWRDFVAQSGVPAVSVAASVVWLADSPAGLGFLFVLPLGIGVAITIRLRTVGVHLRGGDVRIRCFWTTRVIPLAHVTSIETEVLRRWYGTTRGAEIWFELDDGTTVRAPVRYEPFSQTAYPRRLTKESLLDGLVELKEALALEGPEGSTHLS